MASREGKGKFVGGLVLITLGVLIILDTVGRYEFFRSWPLLLIVMSVAILVHRVRDWSGWFIGAAGLVFFAVRNYGEQFQQAASYIIPALFIIGGIYLLVGYIKNRRRNFSK